jgi:triphosphatase
MPTEIEAKFLLETTDAEPQVLAFLKAQGLALCSTGAVEEKDWYWDTPDWRLYRQGWAYRWRQSGQQRLLGFKALTKDHSLLQQREECEIAVETFPHPALPPPAPLADRLDGTTATLRELFRVVKLRRRYLAKLDKNGSIEVSFDQTLLHPPASTSNPAPGRLDFFELELELKQGSATALLEIAHKIQKDMHLTPARLSKFERGLQAAGLEPPRSV